MMSTEADCVPTRHNCSVPSDGERSLPMAEIGRAQGTALTS
jgi:hypothetical protein